MEFELIQLKYLDLLEKSTDVMDAIKFANAELSMYHITHRRGKASQYIFHILQLCKM